MSDGGSDLRAQLARVDGSREQIAKAWLVDVILNSDLEEIGQMPLEWAARELPLLIGDIVRAMGTERGALDEEGLRRAARLAELSGSSASAAQLAREVSYLHSALLGTLRVELADADPDLFSEGAQRLASLFTQLAGHTVEALARRPEGEELIAEPLSGSMMQRLEQMVAATKRYGSPFALLVLDFDGPGAQDPEKARGFVSHAVRGSIRLMDEAYPTKEDGLWVLAPNQTAASAAQMANRLTEILERLERASGLKITVSAGIVACPEHGEEPSELLRAADTAMWRARATGQSVTVAALQDR